ncbi:MAG: biopolymer transporter ExbD [Saprospiraceae bacterium]|nr:biopolymer transporter ExbD [Saprospiraceae bacterium]MBK8082138.1 biopolymer transporter ExbD [Saprospiraceae bacterium]
MAVKKRSKVSAEFNMSSLTDIIFLLLIFFMLTSSSIMPNALNLQLPGRKSKAPPSKAENKIIGVMKDGTYTLNSVPVSMSGIESTIRSLKQRDGEQAAFVVSPSGDADNESVVAILDLAWRMEIKAVLNDPQ